MRQSLDMLHKLLVPWSKGTTVTKGVSKSVSALFWKRVQQQQQAEEGAGTRDLKDGVNAPDVSFLDSMEDARLLWTRIEETGWIDHCRNVMSSAILVAETLSIRNCSVLVHCSDGWDRTAQVRMIAQTDGPSVCIHPSYPLLVHEH